ncbi:MAG: hypothetical protein AAB501_00035 [Patescibacteria group bacterium]
MEATMLTQNHEEVPMEGVKRVVRLFSLMSFVLGFFTVLTLQEVNLSTTNRLADSTLENNARIEELANTPVRGTIGCEPTSILTLARKYIVSEI